MKTSGAATTTRRLGRLGKPTRQDVVSGLVTGLFSIPEGMAYASIGGFNPILGLYAGVVPTIVGSLLARTVLMVTTLTSAIALTSQSVLAQAGLDPANFANVATLTIMVGIVMFIFGLLKLGSAMSFVSNAVMTGFTTGIAVQIVVGVFKDATGYSAHRSNTVIKAVETFTHISQWHWQPVLVTALTVLVWWVANRIKRVKTLATLIALVVMTFAVTVSGLAVDTVKSIATIHSQLPALTLPNLAAAPHLITGAVAVALVALAQAAGISTAVPNPDGSRTSVSKDFIAQGAANMVGGFFQSLPAGGSLSRTGVATSTGSRTRWAGVFSGIWLTVIVLVAGSVANYIPMAVIAGLVAVIGVELIRGRISDIVLVFRTAPLSAIAMVGTFVATTQLPLQQAIIIGAVLSMVLYCVAAARGAHVSGLEPTGDGRWREVPVPAVAPSRAVTVLQYGGVSLFAEVRRLMEHWPSIDASDSPVIIFYVRSMADVPSTSLLKTLSAKADAVRARGGRMMMVGLDQNAYHVLERSGFTDHLGQENVFRASDVVFGALDEAYEDAEKWLDEKKSKK